MGDICTDGKTDYILSGTYDFYVRQNDSSTTSSGDKFPGIVTYPLLCMNRITGRCISNEET